MIHYMIIICFIFTRITINHSRIFHQFFFLFVSALALFLVYPYAKFFSSLFILFLERSVFLFSLQSITTGQPFGLWRRHIWTSLLRCTPILVGVSSKLLNSYTPKLLKICFYLFIFLATQSTQGSMLSVSCLG